MTNGISVDHDDVPMVADPTRHGAFSGTDSTDEPNHGYEIRGRHKKCALFSEEDLVSEQSVVSGGVRSCIRSYCMFWVEISVERIRGVTIYCRSCPVLNGLSIKKLQGIEDFSEISDVGDLEALTRLLLPVPDPWDFGNPRDLFPVFVRVLY